MILNLTFFVQVLNFWIGYWLLNFFIFKPILKEIKLKNEQKKDQELTLEKLSIKIDKTSEKIKLFWSDLSLSLNFLNIKKRKNYIPVVHKKEQEINKDSNIIANEILSIIKDS